ncbi:hypothetical protein CROQUDRAFT_654076 [Cronartium quercuum f. sp. fusiforme G11]|uniref:Uncharacterized protein n=1 Tax=Cronartium quercuum f. sp. fusiforme G11 TaxID=708437 RepID=A0A9P6NT26_9BASI|nr:hypothetical protein CROQUDRAFT_654076 [Cronartium quercuum f. sp. fusiforme G11]
MATSIEEWRKLRAELSNTSAPDLPKPARFACWALVGLSLLGALLHFIHFIVSWVSHRNERRFFSCNTLGYRRPVLSTILPATFTIHALLNLAAMIGLLTDLSSARFRGRTNAIQQASYSLLVCAGLFKTWDIVSRLPSLSPAFAPSRALIKPNHLPPKLCNAFTFFSLILVVILPVPCIVLTSTAIDTLDNLTPALVTTIDTILVNATNAAIDQASHQIRDLEAAADMLAVHTRMLAGLHLLFTTVTLVGFLVASFALARSLRAQVSVFRDSLEYRYELAAAKAKAAGVTCLPPARVPVRARFDQGSPYRPLCGGGELAAFALKYAELEAEARQVKVEAGLLIIVAAAFIVLQLCVVTDAFKYPTRTSLGTILLIAIQWACWSWAGVPGPLLGIVGCVYASGLVPALGKAENVEERQLSLESFDRAPSSGMMEQDWQPKLE